MTVEMHYEWLGISAREQPPDHYRLLGVSRFESNVDVIREAARLRMEQIRQQPYTPDDDPRPLMNRVLAARECLVDAESRYSYETRLRAELALQQLRTPDPEVDDTPVETQAASEFESPHPVSILETRVYARPKRKQPPTLPDIKSLPNDAPAPAATTNRGWWQATVGLLLLAAGIGIGRVWNTPDVTTFDSGAPSAAEAVIPPDGPIAAASPESVQQNPVASTRTTAASGTVPPAGGAAAGNDEPGNAHVSDAQAEVAANPSSPGTAEGPIEEATPKAPDGGEAKAADRQAVLAEPAVAGAIAPAIVAEAAGEAEAIDEAEAAVEPRDDVDPPGKAEPIAVAELQAARPAELPAGALSVVRVLPPPLPFRSSVDREDYLTEISRLLEQGEDTRRGKLSDATRHYHAARDILAGDSRLEYAYGLVLLRFLRYDEAAAQFDAAAQLPLSYLPAHEGAVWVRLLRRDYAAAEAPLARLADSIENAGGEWPGRAARESSAAWVGRILGFFEGPGSSLRGAEEFLVKFREAVSPIVSEPWLQAIERGRTAVEEDRRRLLQAIDQVGRAADVERDELNARKQDELSEKQQETVESFEKLQMSAEKWQEWIKKQTEEIDAQLSELSEAYTRDFDRAQSYSSEIANMQTQMMAFESSIGSPGASTFRANQEINARRIRILQLQRQMSDANQRAEAVRQQASALMVRRAAAVDRFQKATGQILKGNEDLKKIEQRLNRQLTGLEKPAAGAPPEVAALRAKLTSLRTYLEPDFEKERLRILSSYDRGDAAGPAGAGPPHGDAGQTDLN